MATATASVLYANHELDGFGVLDAGALEVVSERVLMALEPRITTRRQEPADERQVLDAARQAGAQGVIFEVLRGVPRRLHLRLARAVIRDGLSVYLYWPSEQAVERLDEERIASYWRLLVAYKVVGTVLRRDTTAPATIEVKHPAGLAPTGYLDELISDPRPVPLDALANGGHRAARGVYARLDYWARLSFGGSYTHTCFVARELAAASRDLLCVMGSHFEMLEMFGLRQGVVPPPFDEASVAHLLQTTDHYAQWLESVVPLVKPDYFYERLCSGNAAVAAVARRHRIPYIIEYNGSEIEMSRAYGGELESAAQLERIEMAAFAQASLIVAISDRVAESLVRRGVDPSRILVSPNGVDPDFYRPADPAARRAVREQLGFAPDDIVIGFIGAFGGWHGIEVLADALAPTCAADSRVRWLLIGDGNLRHVTDRAIERDGLQERVVSTGSVPQAEGARMLGACDIFVVPHKGGIGHIPFFGSPTKLFEYMACGQAIVASDLEQIGDVLRPGMTLRDLEHDAPVPDGARAVLVAPGSDEELARAVIHLVRRDDVRPILGGNARAAAMNEYSWARNIQRVWEACDRLAKGLPASEAPISVSTGPRVEVGSPTANGHPSPELNLIHTGDRYKDEVQKQWNNDPCGSQYVKDRELHSLEWFLEAERYRYDEYGPWMPEVMEFSRHAGEKLLEIGAGMGTDLAQFARHGAIVTDCDLSAGHLALAKENFRLRGLSGTFVHGDGETLPFPDNTFDVVYSNGVIHHTPNTDKVTAEIHRVLRPGGKVIVMVYAEDSWHYWRNLVAEHGIRKGALDSRSVGDLMSEVVELGTHGAKPLVKVYTRSRLRRMFAPFRDVTIVKRQLTGEEVKAMPLLLRHLPISILERAMGWNLIIKGYK